MKKLGLFGLAVALALPATLGGAVITSETQGYYYVRADASCGVLCDGSDWNNAWTELPSNLQRGHTYYIADGTYPSHHFEDAESGTEVIHILKATESAHGTDVGWDSAYGDGQAVFMAAVSFSNSYYVWDGVVGSGANESSYGFRVEPPSDSLGDTHHRLMNILDGACCVEIRHTEIENWGGAYPSNQTAIYGIGGSTGIVIANNYMYHHVATLLIRDWQNCIIENNYFQSNWSGSGYHGEHISTAGSVNNVLRYNVFEDNHGSGVLHVVGTGLDRGWEIYSNVFFGGSTGRPTISTSSGAMISDSQAYNNTFVDLVHAGFSATNGTGNVAYNNLFYSCPMAYWGGITHDYSWVYDSYQIADGEAHAQISTGDPFVDLAGEDFHLRAPTDPGFILSSPFDIDPDGKSRGGDGTWDRGAYEFSPALTLLGRPASEAIHLDWTVNATLPPTATWHIDYYTTAATVPFTATDPFSITRAYTLTDHVVNYEWYTVTLHAMVGSTSWVSDTVRVMPTNLFVHLPIVMKED